VAQYSILLADGDQEYINFLSGTLNANGFNAESTSSGADALKKFKTTSPHLVVIDQVLSDMSGLRLLDDLRKYNSSALVILTTKSAEKDIITRAFRAGVLDILEKPLDPEFLITKIRDFLAREDRDLSGNLQMMSLASIIQINCEERNQAQLSLTHPGKEGTIFFKDGEMVHAETGDLTGEDALYALLGWDAGTFQVKMGVEPKTRTIDKAWSGLLLEGMRRIDESTAAWSPDWEEETVNPEEKSGDPIQVRIVKAIGNIRDVQSALIYAADGTLIAQEKSSDPDWEVELGSVLQEKATFIGGLLDGGKFERIVLTGSGNRIYLQQQDEDLIFLNLAARSSTETVFESVQTIYKRYRSA